MHKWCSFFVGEPLCHSPQVAGRKLARHKAHSSLCESTIHSTGISRVREAAPSSDPLELRVQLKHTDSAKLHDFNFMQLGRVTAHHV
jgi:hypothetical protein